MCCKPPTVTVLACWLDKYGGVLQSQCSLHTTPSLLACGCETALPALAPLPLPLQRTFDIWSFALKFFWRLWLVNKKFTYGKEGMTPERVSARKSELVRARGRACLPRVWRHKFYRGLSSCWRERR